MVPFSFDTYDNRRCGIDNLFPVLIVKIISSPAPRDGRADIRAYKTQRGPHLAGPLAFWSAAGYEQSCTVFGLGSGFHHQWTLIFQLLCDCRVSRSFRRGGGSRGVRENSCRPLVTGNELVAFGEG